MSPLQIMYSVTSLLSRLLLCPKPFECDSSIDTGAFHNLTQIESSSSLHFFTTIIFNQLHVYFFSSYIQSQQLQSPRDIVPYFVSIGGGPLKFIRGHEPHSLL